jgi:hypothetical protein
MLVFIRDNWLQIVEVWGIIAGLGLAFIYGSSKASED